MKGMRLIAGIMALGLLFAACGGGDGDDGFSSEIRNEFMSGCEADGGTAFCECALDELEKIYTEDEFIRVGLEAFSSGNEDPPEEMMGAVLACIDKIEIGG